MTKVTHEIVGGDYEIAGGASKKLKDMLKRAGVEPKTIRRTMIAAYEAEVNVVIHATRGKMHITLTPERLDVEVEDEGPGIADIDQALREGYSTAPSAARALGFGAGMGLPNIRKNSDRFSIESEVGVGSRVRFSIDLRPEESADSGLSSVRVVHERCRQCLQCLHVCPTHAMRMRDNNIQILQHLCTNCTACIQVCQTKALTLRCSQDVPEPTSETILVVPTEFFWQFGSGVEPRHVIEGLHRSGYRHVRLREEWERSLRQAVLEYASGLEAPRLVISPACPAIVNLIEIRFPSLIGNLAPFEQPIVAAREELTGLPAVFVAICPSQCGALYGCGLSARTTVIGPNKLVRSLMPLVSEIARADETRKTPAPPQESAEKRVLMVSGIRHVVNVLEQVENGQVQDVRVLELFACDQGCFGSPIFSENPFLAHHRWMEACGDHDRPAKAFRRMAPYKGRQGLRLDDNMAVALEKLSKMDALTRSLPGRDCGVCGAPTCAALAEDYVLGRTNSLHCVYAKQEGVVKS